MAANERHELNRACLRLIAGLDDHRALAETFGIPMPGLRYVTTEWDLERAEQEHRKLVTAAACECIANQLDRHDHEIANLGQQASRR